MLLIAVIKAVNPFNKLLRRAMIDKRLPTAIAPTPIYRIYTSKTKLVALIGSDRSFLTFRYKDTMGTLIQNAVTAPKNTTNPTLISIMYPIARRAGEQIKEAKKSAELDP
jgi:hypothetical protein